MIEYKEIFSNKIKLLLPYFVEFSNNEFMLSKIYLENCTVGSSD